METVQQNLALVEDLRLTSRSARTAPKRALREARVRVVDRGRNMIRWELRIPAGEAPHHFGDQHSFIDLGHRDHLRPSRGNRQPQLSDSGFSLQRRPLGHPPAAADGVLPVELMRARRS
jgi:hypothetical protein